MDSLQEFQITVKPRRTAFGWIVKIEPVTIQDLVAQIHRKYTDIEFSDYHLVSLITNGKDYTPVTDEDLQNYLKVRAAADIRTITVEFTSGTSIFHKVNMNFVAQKPFSGYTSIADVCRIYGIPGIPSTFKCGKCQILFRCYVVVDFVQFQYSMRTSHLTKNRKLQ